SAVALRYLLIAEACKRNGNRITALTNLFKYITGFSSDKHISLKRLSLMIIELSLPMFYNLLKNLKREYFS
ncbi:MAG: hypothetical protein ACFFCW_43585, partial [Candidatus Hodarchaeota archaeon]